MALTLKCADLFCGAGGAAAGLHTAGFQVEGWDIAPQPRYPFAFHLEDALQAKLTGFDFVWASPPCQKHSRLRRTVKKDYPCFIGPIREKLNQWGGPYIIENVPGSPLHNPLMLCGAMFGLRTYRHRWFESNLFILEPPHPPHAIAASRAGHYMPGSFISVAGNCAPIALAREVMGIDWMRWYELAESIPPVFSEFLGRQVRKLILQAKNNQAKD